MAQNVNSLDYIKNVTPASALFGIETYKKGTASQTALDQDNYPSWYCRFINRMYRKRKALDAPDPDGVNDLVAKWAGEHLEELWSKNFAVSQCFPRHNDCSAYTQHIAAYTGLDVEFAQTKEILEWAPVTETLMKLYMNSIDYTVNIAVRA